MAYTKFLVDNPICTRRFHLFYDTDDKAVRHTEAKCPHCGVVVFAADDHPAVKMARDENLTKTTILSDNLVKTCQFKDTFSPPPKINMPGGADSPFANRKP